METERSISRVDDKDVVEPHVWQIDKVYQTESKRIDRYLREQAKALVTRNNSLSDEKISDEARNEQERLKTTFCLMDDEALDIEVYERARKGELRQEAPKPSLILLFHIGALVLALCEISLFVVQAMLLDEYRYVPIIFGVMIVLFSWFSGQQLGSAMYKWNAFKKGDTGLGEIGDTPHRGMKLNVVLFIIGLILVLGIALVRSIDNESFQAIIFIFTFSIALGIIGMEAWAAYQKFIYNDFVSVMIKAQRSFATKNHWNMYREKQWEMNFIGHIRNLKNLMYEQSRDSLPAQNSSP